MRNVASKETKKLVYISMIESILRYGLELWGSACTTELEKVKNLQVRALKNVMGYKSRSQFILNAFQDLNVLDIFGLYKRKILVNNFNNADLRVKVIHKHDTRQQVDGYYYIPKSHNKYGDSTSKVIVPKLFNLTPKDFLEMTKNAFKRKIKKWLLENIT